MLLGVGAAWLANFGLFGIWGLAVRDHAIAVTLTGFAIAGVGTSGDGEDGKAPPGRMNYHRAPLCYRFQAGRATG